MEKGWCHGKRVVGNRWGFGKVLGPWGGDHTTVTPWQKDHAMEQGPQHGEGIVPQEWDHTGDMGSYRDSRAK